jgi:hypothetical protein
MPRQKRQLRRVMRELLEDSEPMGGSELSDRVHSGI